LTPFFEFLLEKNFVRPITGSELAALKAKVQSVECSNCGAPLDLAHDAACRYCDRRAHSVDVDRLADALLMRPPSEAPEARSIAGDLVGAGLSLIASMLAS
jgi:hypothetical protein